MRASAAGFLIKRPPLRRVAMAAACAACVVVAAPSAAMTLGNVASQSALGQSLRLVIPVSAGSDEAASTSCLKLLTDAAPGDTPQLVTGRVSFERAATGSRIVVTTTRPVNEPALRVSVQSGCGNTTRRDYVLLFDPPVPTDASVVQDTPLMEAIALAEAAKASATRVSGVAAPARSAAKPAQPEVAKTIVALAPAQAGASHASHVATTTYVELTPVSDVTVAPNATAPRPVGVTAASPPATPPARAQSPSAAPSLRIVTMTGNAASSGFISTATAQPLQPVPSVQAAQPSPIVERLWPYAAVVLCLAGLGMCALAVRKQRAARSPSWMAAADAASKLGADTHAALNTFAHFGEMTEPPSPPSKPTAEKREAAAPAPVPKPRGELDTLLGDDGIDEKTIREEWAAAASEHAIDIGTDSILQAIATAEREMRISAPPPAQVAMDQALDDELLRKPRKR